MSLKYFIKKIICINCDDDSVPIEPGVTAFKFSRDLCKIITVA